MEVPRGIVRIATGPECATIQLVARDARLSNPSMSDRVWSTGGYSRVTTIYIAHVLV